MALQRLFVKIWKTADAADKHDLRELQLPRAAAASGGWARTMTCDLWAGGNYPRTHWLPADVLRAVNAGRSLPTVDL